MADIAVLIERTLSGWAQRLDVPKAVLVTLSDLPISITTRLASARNVRVVLFVGGGDMRDQRSLVDYVHHARLQRNNWEGITPLIRKELGRLEQRVLTEAPTDLDVSLGALQKSKKGFPPRAPDKSAADVFNAARKIASIAGCCNADERGFFKPQP